MKIAIIGLGYVGLPLVVEFGKRFKTIGFDIDSQKVLSCKEGKDPSCEISEQEMASASKAIYTDDESQLKKADVIIVAVPTPVDESRKPDFSPLKSASQVIGNNLKSGALVIYESTVYPGATEEVCIPIIEEKSGKKWKKDFFVGYSPERINPGDKTHTLTKVVKVVAGDTPETLDKVAELYETVVEPGVHRTSSIKAAEASKVIENTQRDLNIALMNELSLIFNQLDIDTLEVLEAAGTKWNFLNFRPGLVGGHCIGVDPYYLTYKAETLGYHPQVILAGRRINDGMGKYIAEQTVKQMIKHGGQVKRSRVNILGLTFKEDCADIRNTKVVDIVNELHSYGVEVNIHDPYATSEDVQSEFGLTLTNWEDLPQSDALILAVSHQEYLKMDTSKITAKVIAGGVVIDVKSKLDAQEIQVGGFSVWRL